jgi:uncharacterized surface protein with fasciclin (FAS1) repeats
MNIRFLKQKTKARLLEMAALITPLLGGVGGGLFTSCTDWNDHYDTGTALTESQQAPLLENITKNPELSQFASLLSKTGFDQQLNSSQTFTVWAPMNNTFNYDELMATGNDRLLRQFVKNHVARNNYPATGALDQKVFMLNEKLMHFQGSGQDYTIQDIALKADQQNIGSNNGTLHLINGKIPYLPNIYESLNNEQFALDSISEYYHQYDVRTLDELRSVPGPIVNGEQTYLDSIFNESNNLYRNYRAYIHQEDSNYTMILPTNTAWTKAYNRIQQYYKYVPTMRYIDVTPTGTDSTVVVNLKNPAQLCDSITKYKILTDLVYNNNIYDNRKLPALQEGEMPKNDSIVSTMGNILYADDVKGLFTDAKRVDKSNGAIWVTDTLNLPAWSSWNPELTIEAESYFFKTVYTGKTSIQRISADQNPYIKGNVSNGRYIEITPNSPGDQPEIYFFLPGVRSTEYNVYVVMLPSNIKSTSVKYYPNSFSAGLRYMKEDGTLVSETSQRNANPLSGIETNTTFVTSLRDETLPSQGARIDTLFIGSVTFPVAYYGTGDSAPYLRLRSRFSSTVGNKITPDRSLRIDCIILRPKELDDYLTSHPGYVYDKHNVY